MRGVTSLMGCVSLGSVRSLGFKRGLVVALVAAASLTPTTLVNADSGDGGSPGGTTEPSEAGGDVVDAGNDPHWSRRFQLGMTEYCDKRYHGYYRYETYNEPNGMYLMSDGSIRLSPGTPGPNDPVALYEGWTIWCDLPASQGGGPPYGGVHQKMSPMDYWKPLVTVDSVAYQSGLIRITLDDLPDPAVTFVDADAADGWLYVNVPHHVEVTVAESVRSEQSVGQVSAYVEATPTKLTVSMPSETGVEGLAECDLDAASDGGCEIKFKHASSISQDGTFHGTATVEWMISSNSGKYEGLGPFTTTAQFEIQVAEAMAVS